MGRRRGNGKMWQDKRHIWRRAQTLSIEARRMLQAMRILRKVVTDLQLNQKCKAVEYKKEDVSNKKKSRGSEQLDDDREQTRDVFGKGEGWFNNVAEHTEKERS